MFEKNFGAKGTAKLVFVSFFLVASGITFAQNPPATAQATPALPANASAKKVDEFLATLRPPTSFKALLNGNDLLLDIPDIARAGSVKVRAVSTIGRTDALWLLSLHAMPDSGNAMFVGLQFDMSALPEATLNLQLYKTQPVLLVARSGGKYYGIYREVKVGQGGPKDRSKGNSNPVMSGQSK